MPKTKAYRKAALGAAVLAGGDLLRPHMPQSAGPVTPAQAERMKKRVWSRTQIGCMYCARVCG